jgi:hypothetical protein
MHQQVLYSSVSLSASPKQEQEQMGHEHNPCSNNCGSCGGKQKDYLVYDDM